MIVAGSQREWFSGGAYTAQRDYVKTMKATCDEPGNRSFIGHEHWYYWWWPSNCLVFVFSVL